MIVIDPNDTNHTIKIIPRFTPVDALVFDLYDETLRTSATIANTYTYLNGILLLTFDLVCVEASKYQIKLSHNSDILYRDKIFVTEQQTESYKTSENLYFYE